MYYSKQTNGFYDRAIHGDFKIQVPDPNWTRPVRDVVVQPGESVQINEAGERFKNVSDVPFTLENTPDFTVEAPTVEIDNPNCKIPADAIEITAAEHAALLKGQTKGKIITADENGYPVLIDPPAPTSKQIEAAKVARVQQHMDEAARALRYDDIKTAVTYAEETAVPKFQAEGQAFRAWRSLVWAACYAILDDVNAGNRGVPTDAELIAELPDLVLPE